MIKSTTLRPRFRRSTAAIRTGKLKQAKDPNAASHAANAALGLDSNAEASPHDSQHHKIEQASGDSHVASHAANAAVEPDSKAEAEAATKIQAVQRGNADRKKLKQAKDDSNVVPHAANAALGQESKIEASPENSHHDKEHKAASNTDGNQVEQMKAVPDAHPYGEHGAHTDSQHPNSPRSLSKDHEAATKIQAIHRGNTDRKQIERKKADSKAQNDVDGDPHRGQLHNMEATEEPQAAIKI